MIDFNFPIVILSSPPVLVGFVFLDLQFCRSLFVLLSFFFLAIMLSVLLRYTDSDYLPLVSSNSSYYSRISHKNNRSSSSSLSSSSSFFIIVVIIIFTILITNAAFSFIINQILILFFYNLLIDFVIDKQMNNDQTYPD